MRDAVMEEKVRVEEPPPVNQLLTGVERLVALLNLSLPDARELDMTRVTMRRPVDSERDDR